MRSALAPFTPSGVAHRSASASVLWRVYDLDSHEWIFSNIEELKFPEICIGRVEGSDVVLSKECCKVSVRDQVPMGCESSCHLLVYAQEVFLFADHMCP